MKNIKQNIQHALYGYDKNEFLPVFVDGQWANQNEFRAYKLRKVTEAIGRAAMNMAEHASEAQNKLYNM